MNAATGIALDEIAARIPAHVAQLAVAKVFAQVGSEADDWDSGTLDRVMRHLDVALPYLVADNALPSPYSLKVTDGLFWAQQLADDD